MTSTNDIRAIFLDYFASLGHQIIPSSSLVPDNDPTLLFTNAGMVQFKNVFAGQETRSYKRATTAQKVLRAGGKHNDLDNVGYTARHHTFFEMMGNFSFGDYFKEQAIEYAWKLITREFGLPIDRLLVTVFAEDDTSFSLWKKIAGLSEDRIIRISTSDNFWRMAETGPCGPCSEIFYDHGDDVPGGFPGTSEQDGDRFVEIWNLVFMQYYEDPPGQRTILPKPSIDTGMGLERMAAISQGKRDNYDIDLLRSLIMASADVTGQSADGPFKISHRVVADHLRSTAFLIADGVLPGRDGRSYVLRRIMRRAMRHLHIMGTTEPVFYKLVPALIRQMGAAYPELVQASPLIGEIIRLEEEQFKSLLYRGLRLLSDEAKKLRKGQPLPGTVAFKLYDTYGFPVDMTADAMREAGHDVDMNEFRQVMADQQQRAKAAWIGSGDQALESVWFGIQDHIGPSEFLGYTSERNDCIVKAIVVDGQRVDSAAAGTEVAIVLNQTPFYAESGGQVNDTGQLLAPGTSVLVTDTQKRVGNIIVHFGRVEEGVLQTEKTVTAVVDHERRQAIRRNHSATHLLHAALRHRLGDTVIQKGSFNGPDYLRFDMSHTGPIKQEDLYAIEAEVNSRIRMNTPLKTRVMRPEDAVNEGAIALFNEKYGNEVRVVSFGDEIVDDKNRSWSIELCGGTHVARTGDIGAFYILNESGISTGIRRIEAITGPAVEACLRKQKELLLKLSELLLTSEETLIDKVIVLIDNNRLMTRQISDLQIAIASAQVNLSTREQHSEKIAGIPFITQTFKDISAKDLKGLADRFSKQVKSGIIALVSIINDKTSIVVAVTPDLTLRFNAIELVRAAGSALGSSGGGGRPHMAQAGGTKINMIPAAFDAIRMLVLKQTSLDQP